MNNRFEKAVHLHTEGDAFNALFLDFERSELRPNLVFVNSGGSVLYEINEAGLKGDALDPSRKTVVVWGDSVVFGVGRSWPCLIDRLAPGYQFLCGGILGDPYANILRRAREFNSAHPVALNLLMLGWHPNPVFLDAANGITKSGPERRWLVRVFRGGAAVSPLNRQLAKRLSAFLEAVPNTVLLTMPTALNRKIADLDLSQFFVDAFTFLSRLPYSIDVQRGAFDFICERNRIAREICAELNIPVVDLFERFNTEGQADFRTHFADILHFRPHSFPLVAETVYQEIKDLLQ